MKLIERKEFLSHDDLVGRWRMSEEVIEEYLRHPDHTEDEGEKYYSIERFLEATSSRQFLKRVYLSAPEIVERNWNLTLIKRLLGRPDKVISGIGLYTFMRIFEAERSVSFSKHIEKHVFMPWGLRIYRAI